MDDLTLITQSLMRLLAMREHSQKELYRKLGQKDYATELVEKAINSLAEQDLQSDQRYVEMMIRSAHAKGHGPNRLWQSLQQNGIDRELYDQCMTGTDIDWWQLAYQVKEKKFGDAVEQDWKQKQRQQRFLLNRGFNIDQINYAIAFQASTDA